MLSWFDYVRDISIAAVSLRMVTAMVCGGLIGLEREFKRRPAGFRTHILICLGAAMTTLTSQYMYLSMHMYTDIARLGSQVICGIGFIGAGTIIFTKRQRVKGLTTAAGLWTDAIIGLVCGAGYIECALVATCMVLMAETLLIKIEYRFARKAEDVSIYVEYLNPDAIEKIIKTIKEHKAKVTGLEISRAGAEGEHHFCAVLTVHSGHKYSGDAEKSIRAIEGVSAVEEL